jgi:SAM-dependent methyltransferase
LRSQTLYDVIGQSYARHRQADPRIAAAIVTALGDAGSVLNVGAGSGSYEPRDRPVVAVEPSAVMLAQRASGSAPVVQAQAEGLPFSDAAFDAVLGVLTLHHWASLAAGLRECIRVARKRVVFLTCDPAAIGFWLTRDYFPEFIERDREQFPSIDVLNEVFGPHSRVDSVAVPIPRDCLDGFLGAFWGRPTAYLDAGVRSGISSFARDERDDGLERLRSDLADGTWAARHGHLLGLDELDIGYRLVVAHLQEHQSS